MTGVVAAHVAATACLRLHYAIAPSQSPLQSARVHRAPAHSERRACTLTHGAFYSKHLLLRTSEQIERDKKKKRRAAQTTHTDPTRAPESTSSARVQHTHSAGGRRHSRLGGQEATLHRQLAQAHPSLSGAWHRHAPAVPPARRRRGGRSGTRGRRVCASAHTCKGALAHTTRHSCCGARPRRRPPS